MERRTLIGMGLGAAASAAFAANPAAQAAGKPIKVGLLYGFSGLSASGGTYLDRGLAVFLDQFGDTVAGRKVEIIRRDTTGPAPDLVRRLAQELIVRDQVDALVGFDYTVNTLAAAPLSTRGKKPLLIVNSTSSGFLGEFPYLVRFGITQALVAQQLAKWAARNNLKRVHTLVSDFQPGYDAEAMFTKTFTAAGGSIAGSLRVPLRNFEFSAYMQRIKDTKPDALFVFVPAGDIPVSLAKAYAAAEMRQAGVQLLDLGGVTDEGTLDAVGPAALGMISAYHYSPTHQSAVNKDFVGRYQRLAGAETMPNFTAVTIRDVMYAFYKAVEQQDGKIDPDRTIELLGQSRFESPRGPLQVDPRTRDAVQNIYIRRVEQQDGKIVNVEFETEPMLGDPTTVLG